MLVHLFCRALFTIENRVLFYLLNEMFIDIKYPLILLV